MEEFRLKQETVEDIYSQWRKKVLIEKCKIDFDNEEAVAFLVPKVTVSRGSSRLPSESGTVVTASTYLNIDMHDTIYELESDPEWEVDREELE